MPKLSGGNFQHSCLCRASPAPALHQGDLSTPCRGRMKTSDKLTLWCAGLQATFCLEGKRPASTEAAEDKKPIGWRFFAGGISMGIKQRRYLRSGFPRRTWTRKTLTWCISIFGKGMCTPSFPTNLVPVMLYMVIKKISKSKLILGMNPFHNICKLTNIKGKTWEVGDISAPFHPLAVLSHNSPSAQAPYKPNHDSFMFSVSALLISNKQTQVFCAFFFYLAGQTPSCLSAHHWNPGSSAEERLKRCGYTLQGSWRVFI